MVADVRIDGAEHFAQVARALRAAGAKELRRELYRGLNRATKPLKDAAKANAGSTLPQRGGLARRVQRARFSTKGRAGANPSVSIVAKTGKQSVDLKALDDGSVRHPTFGRKPWVRQGVEPGWFTKPMLDGADEVLVEVLAAVDAVAKKLAQ